MGAEQMALIGELSRRWKIMLKEGLKIIGLLPEDQAEECLFASNGALISGGVDEIREALDLNKCFFLPQRV